GVVWWFGSDAMNLAIVTGAGSGVVVVDADSQDAIRWAVHTLPYTPWQTRTSRGYHLYYRHPEASVRNRARIETREGRLAIDVRADGGFVIAAVSIHASGAEYEEAGDWSEPKVSLPVFWPGWLERPKRTASRPAPRHTTLQ